MNPTVYGKEIRYTPKKFRNIWKLLGKKSRSKCTKIITIFIKVHIQSNIYILCTIVHPPVPS